MITYCDECGADFEVSIKEERKQDVDKMYFNCTNCGHEYIVSFTNNKIEEFQDNLESLYSQLRLVTDPDKVLELWKMINESEQIIKDEAKRLMVENVDDW